MGKKNRLLLLVIFSSILFLGSSITPISSFDYDWALGGPYPFGIHMYEYDEERDTENGNYEIEEWREAIQLNFNVTRIDLETKRLDFSYYYPDGYLDSWTNYDFDMAIYSENIFTDIDDFFYINYHWNIDTESVVLVSFALDFWFEPPFFVEPNWTAFNNALVNLFDGSFIVDTVDVPSSEVDIEITFGYFLESLTMYTINNKNSLSGVLNQFTSSNTELSMHFDLANVIHDYYYDSDLGRNVYTPMEEFKLDFEVSYSKGGLLDYYLEREEVALTNEEEEEYNKAIYEYSMAFGGLKSLPLNLICILPALLVSVLIMKYSMKKKKEKVINEL